jgi:hypothetical protein
LKKLSIHCLTAADVDWLNDSLEELIVYNLLWTRGDAMHSKPRWPNRLTKLVIENGGSAPVAPSLRILSLERGPLPKLPQSLVELHLGRGFRDAVPADALPRSLRKVVVDRNAFAPPNIETVRKWPVEIVLVMRPVNRPLHS